MHVLIVFGTRPEIIKLAPVYRSLKSVKGLSVECLWTGQHNNLVDGLFDFFCIDSVIIGKPMLLENSSINTRFLTVMTQIEQVLNQRKYDIILVQGDTLSATAASITCFLSRTAIGHVEAGLRTGDIKSPWPEEFNRRIITLASKLHFAATEGSANNLREEKVQESNIFIVGNTVVDSLLYAKWQLSNGFIPSDFISKSIPPDKKLILATLHRRENIGEPMNNILEALAILSKDNDKHIIIPVHANPSAYSQVYDSLSQMKNITLLPGLCYPDFIYLLNKAWIVVSDSGGIQEEAPTLGLRILITRETTERPEGIKSGFGTLVGSRKDLIVKMVRKSLNREQREYISGENPFGDGNASNRITSIITSNGFSH